MNLLTIFLIFSISSIVNTSYFPRLLQSTPSIIIPQVIYQNIVNTSISLVLSLYSPLIANHKIINVEGLTNSSYRLTYNNGDTSYSATTISYPNNTLSLIDFSQIGWDTISPYNISFPLNQTNNVIKKLYQIESANLININHTFSNNIHTYSLIYQSFTGTIKTSASFNLLNNLTKISSFQSQSYDDPPFRQLPANFSLSDSNLRDSLNHISNLNGTSGFIYNSGTTVDLIANSVSNQGKNIIYYLNLATDGKILETLVSYGLTSDIHLIYFRVWDSLYLEPGYFSINIVNAWEDPGFRSSYYNFIDKNANNVSKMYVSDVQGFETDGNMKRMIFTDRQGTKVINTF